MQRSRWNGYKLTWTNHYLAVLELDYQIAIDANESLVGIRMAMPAKLLGHHAHAYFMVIDLGE